jgi:hypothetical protein
MQGDTQVQSGKISGLVPLGIHSSLSSRVLGGRTKCVLIKSLETELESTTPPPPLQNSSCFCQFRGYAWIMFPNETLVWKGKRRKVK